MIKEKEYLMELQRIKDTIRKNQNKAKGFLRSELARRVKARKMPELVFKFDEALEYGNHINEILNKLTLNEKVNSA